MVRKFIAQRVAAVALIGALTVTFFAPVEAPAQSAKKLLAPGLCTKERHRHLQDTMEAAWSLVRKCSSPPDTVEIMSEKVQRFRDAIIARDNINLECFGRTDDGHNQAVTDLEKGKTHCQERIAAKKEAPRPLSWQMT